MKTVAVVLRKLASGSPVVVTAVIESPTHHVDDLDNYFECRFTEIVNDFCTDFVEFKSATWTLQTTSTVR